MKSFYLYILLSMLTGNPLMAIILVFVIYALVDRYYFGFLPDFTRLFRRNIQIKNHLRELHVNPQNAHAAFSLGVLYFEKKKYGEALKYLEHPRLKNEDSASYFNYLGMTLMELDRVDEGKEYIVKALELEPRAGYGLPYVYLINNEMSQTVPDRNKINELEQKVERFANTEILYKLGMAYRKFGDREKARELFSKAITEYSYCPRGIRRLHRKWALLSRFRRVLNI